MNKKTRKLFTWCLVVCMVVVQMLFANVAFAATNKEAGSDRYQTAIQVVKAGWTTSENAVIARGDDLADALAAAPLAYAKGKAPILLTETNALPTGVMEELTALGVKNVYIVGGTGAVSQAVQDALAAKFTVKRLFGADRAATSLAVAKEAFTAPTKAVMVNGEAYADALSISSIAANQGMPILLVGKDAMSADVAAYLTGKTVYAVGGTGVISDAVVANATRLSGADRYATNVAVLKAFTLNYADVFVAVGEDANAVDALGGAAFAALGNNPIVLVDKALTTAASDLLKANLTATSDIYVLGGVVPAAVVSALEALVPVDATLKVESVSATNLMEVKVVFNKAVDEETAEDVTNYAIGGVALDGNAAAPDDTAVLQADGKTVVLTLLSKGALTNQTDYTLTVSNVEDTAGNVIDDTDVDFTATDVTIPTVVSAKVTGPYTVQVTYSEPMQTSPTFTVDDGTYYAAPTFTAGSKTTTLTLGTKLTEGTHKVIVTGGTDYYGFAIVKTTTEFAYAIDKVIPTVSVEKATETVVTLNFSKPVKVTGTINTNVTAYYAYNKTASFKGTLAVDPDAVDASGYSDVYTVTFTTPVPTGSQTLYLNTAANTFEDKWGNDVASAVLSFTVVTDNVKPQVATVVAEEDDKLLVTFNEAVVASDAQNKLYYTLKDANGDKLTSSDYGFLDANGHFAAGAAIVYADKVATITLNAPLTGGAYYLAVEKVRDLAYVKNTMDAATLGFQVKDTTGPALSTALVNSTGSKIRVLFNEPMSAEGLTTTSNYRLVIDGAASVALPTNSKVAVVDSKTVEITLGTADANIDGAAAPNNDAVQVNGALKDASGNVMGGFYKEVAVAADSITGFVASSAEAVATNKITFEVAQQLKAIDASDFTVVGGPAGTAVANAFYTNDSGSATVTVVLNKDLATDLNDLTKITVGAGALTNVFGTASTSFDIAKAAIADSIVPEITGVATATTTSVALTFSEAIDPNTVSKYTFTVEGNTVTAIGWNAGNTVLTLTLDDAIATDATPAVTQALDLEDANDNVLEAGTAIVATDDGVAPVVTTALTAQIAAGNSATVVFSEELTSAAQTAVETAINGAKVSGTLTFSWDGVTLTVTNTHATNPTAFAADVPAAIADASGNTTAAAKVVDL